MNKKIDINFKQPKYMLPAILYIPLLVTGYLIINIFDFEVEETVDASLVVTEHLNSDLPAAQVSDEIGSKFDNMRRTYGGITDLSAMRNVENDADSLKKTEDFESKYNTKDRAMLDSVAVADSLQARIAERNKLRGKDQTHDEFMKDLTPEERRKILALQGNRTLEELEQQLGLTKGTLQRAIASTTKVSADSAAQGGDADGGSDDSNTANGNVVGKFSATASKRKAVTENTGDTEATVFKKTVLSSSHFNTISANEQQSHLIKAIIDEEVKAVDGSRVRLRLLDDVEIEGATLPKGTYLYATMSGFAKQRVNGTVSSVMINDDIIKINLAIYDTDGMKGLYVPESQFREAAKDISSQALNGGMNVTDGMTTNNSITQWASTALQNAVQQGTQAVSKIIRKNKVRLKYGTQIFLVNGKTENGGSRK